MQQSRPERSASAELAKSDFVAQAVKPAEPRFISAFLGGGLPGKEKAEMNLGSAGLTACATKTKT
jgi:hypothetical protein